jgi:glycopeptide antibiotics resistance protein
MKCGYFSGALRLKNRADSAIGPTYTMASYLFLIVCRTLLLREVNTATRAQLTPFWTYYELAKGDRQTQYLGKEILLNVLMLFPLGILLPCLEYKFWKTVCIGAGISIGIEVLQLLDHRGLFEFDDIFHNVLGVVIGYLVYFTASGLIKKLRKRD